RTCRWDTVHSLILFDVLLYSRVKFSYCKRTIELGVVINFAGPFLWAVLFNTPKHTTFLVQPAIMKRVAFVCLLISQYSFCQLTKLKPGNMKPGFISLTRYDETRTAVKEQTQKDNG